VLGRLVEAHFLEDREQLNQAGRLLEDRQILGTERLMKIAVVVDSMTNRPHLRLWADRELLF